MEGEVAAHVPDAPMEEEETPDLFQCCVCLDLLYKPVVLSCGHMACFWCVHVSMNSFRDSRCPICMNSYKHFPSICRTLHFMLFRLYPVACKRREEQILAEEKKKRCFAPQFFCDAPGSNANTGCDGRLPGCSSATGGECRSSLDHQSLSKGESRPSVPLSDVLCAACKQMLYRPVALNCGHAYCEACIPNQVNGALRCQVCLCFHPSGHPKVCLEFDHFLQMQFPEEYALRRDSVSIDRGDVKTESSGTSVNDGAPIRSAATREHRLQQSHSSLMVHRAGCYCGVIPIIGVRYKCKDCVERIGFDLCGDCYNTRSNRPGRFNQQHTLEHRFERMENNDLLLDASYEAELSILSGRFNQQHTPEHRFERMENVGWDPNYRAAWSSGLFSRDGGSELSEDEFPVITLAGNGSESFVMEMNEEEVRLLEAEACVSNQPKCTVVVFNNYVH